MGIIKTAVKLIITLTLSALVLCAICALPTRLLFLGGESYRFYLGDTSINCREVFTDGRLAPLTKLLLSDINGESATYESLDIDGFLQSVNGQVVFVEEIDGSVNYYCKADLPYSIELYGQEINLHICKKAESVTVASPIIFGGY
ncbi:MAG: hypothetical protein ACI4MN_02690 [Candidatus Coproplasma sp.]